MTVYARRGATGAAVAVHRGARVVTLPTIRQQVSRHGRPHGALGPPCRDPGIRRRPRLQRRERAHVPARAPPRRPDPRRPERGRAREEPPEVERARPPRVRGLRAALLRPPGRPRDGRARDPGLLPRDRTGRTLSTSPTAPTSPRPPAGDARAGSASRRAATSSTSRASSRRTTPTRSSGPTGPSAATTPLVLLGGGAVRGRLRRDREGRRRAATRASACPAPIYGEGYRELLANAALYVHATEVGGTHPALLEAMGFGRPLVVHDTPENREAAGRAALYADAARPETLTRAIEHASRRPGPPPGPRRGGPPARLRPLPLGLRDGRLRKGALGGVRKRVPAALASIPMTLRRGLPRC